MKRRLTMLLVCLSLVVRGVTAQTNVKGIVVSEEDGSPVTGATIQVIGTNTGTVSDVEGRFSLTLPAGKNRLRVSFIGMETRDVTANRDMRIVLKNDATGLDEVMVVAFGKQTRSSFTGSAAILDSKKIEQKQLTNVLRGLTGEVAGVQITSSSGSPISTPTLRVRGYSSINAGKNPLIIVDGSPYDGGWNNLNPNDVASITVLKDAASNALYGARGANGVIMITTKSASSGKVTVTLDAKWGVNSRIACDYDFISDPGQYYETYYKALYNYQVNALGQSLYQTHVNANTMMADTPGNGGLGYIVYTVPNGEYLIGENGKLNPHATLGVRVQQRAGVHHLS